MQCSANRALFEFPVKQGNNRENPAFLGSGAQLEPQKHPEIRKFQEISPK